MKILAIGRGRTMKNYERLLKNGRMAKCDLYYRLYAEERLCSYGDNNIRSEIMDIQVYQKEAMRTRGDLDFLCCGLGLAGEAGECADIIKKWCYHGHKPDKDKLIAELGDVLWYVAATCDLLGVSMEYVMTANIEKLKKRYPEGFSCEASINRKE